MDNPASERVMHKCGFRDTGAFNLCSHLYLGDDRLVKIMRLDGYVRFYIDGHFITGFDDGFSGRFYQLYGAGLDKGGKYVTGSFDNFILRVR